MCVAGASRATGCEAAPSRSWQRGWGDMSVGEVFSESLPRTHVKNLWEVAHTCDSAKGRQRQVGSWASLTSKLDVLVSSEQ